MKQLVTLVTANVEVAARVHVLRFAALGIAQTARPGQFVHLRCARESDPLLRRPLSVLRTVRDPANRPVEAEVLLDVVGRGTALLSQIRPGDALDVLGPLGRPFEVLPTTRRALLIGGGVGIAPLIALAQDLLPRGVEVVLLAGFRSAAKAFPAALVPPEAEYVVATDDGSLGHQGLVTELVGEYRPWADQAFACGPIPMLRALAGLRLHDALPTQVAVEEHMGCAMGVCLGCVVPTRKGLRRVCHDGPVFDIREMVW
ncbi:MAG: dihydroorotate dehydrogenase electron transfer subunit [Chloroflexi bacterium]|nr:dihydroorotate dehydrogenase electron transfer subunit [Chloroflexota bacterium]